MDKVQVIEYRSYNNLSVNSSAFRNDDLNVSGSLFILCDSLSEDNVILFKPS